MSFSLFPTAAFAAVPPSNIPYKIGGGRIAGQFIEDWPHYTFHDDGLPLARIIWPGLPLWKNPNGPIEESFVQFTLNEGVAQASFWVAVLGGQGPFLNVIRAQKARFRSNNPQTGFMCEAEIWRPWFDFSLGIPNDFFSIRNVKFLQDFTINPFEYFEVPMPTNLTYKAPYSLGFCGSMVFAVYAETRSQWSIRTGLST
jgi:hypothetical protein